MNISRKDNKMRTFREDVERAVSYHGHLCSGQCIGVKMARLGLKTLGLDPDVNPKNIYVFVECDRCPADSIGIAQEQESERGPIGQWILERSQRPL